MKKPEILVLKDKIKIRYLNTEIAEIAFYFGKDKILSFRGDKKLQDRILTIKNNAGIRVHMAREDFKRGFAVLFWSSLPEGDYEDPPLTCKIRFRKVRKYLIYQVGIEDPIYLHAMLHYPPKIAGGEPYIEPPEENPPYPPEELKVESELARAPWAYPIIANNLDSYTSLPLISGVLDLGNGWYLLVMPVSAENYSTYMYADARSIRIEPRSFMKINRGGVVPLFAIVLSENPYELYPSAFKIAGEFLDSPLALRSDREFPEFFEYLGWCSWNAYQKDVTEERVLEAVEKLLNSGVKIGFVLLDDGWQDISEDALVSFSANKEKFPNGLKALIRKVKDMGVKYFGVWLTLQGYWRGINPNSELAENFKDVLTRGQEYRDRLIPKPENAYNFFKKYYSRLRRWGVDFLKVDNQFDLYGYFAGKYPVKQAAKIYIEGVEAAACLQGLKILNCMSLIPENYSNWRSSSVARGGIDYIPYWREDFKRHALIYSYNSLWLSPLVWPDYDMFMSDDPLALNHAVLRAVSGGPIYITDRPGKHDVKLLKMLTLSDGRILKADAPTLPSRDTLFNDPYNEGYPLKLVNTITIKGYGVVGLIAVFNIDRWDREIKYRVSPGEVPGLEEGRYLAYEWRSGEMQILESNEKIEGSIPGLGFKLYFLAPLKKDFAVIGNTEKILSPRVVKQIHSTDDGYLVFMEEDGKILFYSEEGLKFKDLKGRVLEAIREDNIYLVEAPSVFRVKFTV